MSTPNAIVNRHKTLCLTILTIWVILFFRQPHTFFNPQFIAEDGLVLFRHIYEDGGIAVFTPFGGYLHIFGLLLAYIASVFPLAVLPGVYVALSLVAYALLTALICGSRFRIDNRIKPFLAAAVFLVPHTGEVFCQLANLTWFASLALLILFFQAPPTRLIHWVTDFLVLLLCALNGPMIIFILPLYLFRCLRHRSRYNWALAATAAATTAIQLCCILRFGQSSLSKPLAGPIEEWAKTIGYRFFGNFFLGESISLIINPYVLLILTVTIIPTAHMPAPIHTRGRSCRKSTVSNGIVCCGCRRSMGRSGKIKRLELTWMPTGKLTRSM